MRTIAARGSDPAGGADGACRCPGMLASAITTDGSFFEPALDDDDDDDDGALSPRGAALIPPTGVCSLRAICGGSVTASSMSGRPCSAVGPAIDRDGNVPPSTVL